MEPSPTALDAPSSFLIETDRTGISFSYFESKFQSRSIPSNQFQFNDPAAAFIIIIMIIIGIDD